MAAKALADPKSKDKSLTIFRDFGIEEAYDPAKPLTSYDVYDADSDAKGTLPNSVLNNEASALNKGLSK